MLDFLNALPEYMKPYFMLMGIALVLSLVVIFWYGFYEWHQHAVMKARKKKYQLPH